MEPLDSKTTPLESNLRLTPELSTKNVPLLISIVSPVLSDKNPPEL